MEINYDEQKNCDILPIEEEDSGNPSAQFLKLVDEFNSLMIYTVDKLLKDAVASEFDGLLYPAGIEIAVLRGNDKYLQKLVEQNFDFEEFAPYYQILVISRKWNKVTEMILEKYISSFSSTNKHAKYACSLAKLHRNLELVAILSRYGIVADDDM
jgi:hypothetical protein